MANIDQAAGIEDATDEHCNNEGKLKNNKNPYNECFVSQLFLNKIIKPDHSLI
jgi:hypothetical protein